MCDCETGKAFVAVVSTASDQQRQMTEKKSQTVPTDCEQTFKSEFINSMPQRFPTPHTHSSRQPAYPEHIHSLLSMASSSSVAQSQVGYYRSGCRKVPAVATLVALNAKILTHTRRRWIHAPSAHPTDLIINYVNVNYMR